MRRRNVKNAKQRIENHPELVIANPKEYIGKWHEVFNNDNPIYLEIGMGKWKFLREHALKNPNINYIGIEKFDSVIVQAVEKIAPLNLINIKLINVDAEELLEIFNANEINKIFLNFSDPWPKNRHQKRRLTSEKFLALYEKVLNGTIEMKTDNRGLFEYSLMSFNNNNWRFKELSLDLHAIVEDEEPKEIITTEYEDRFVEKGNVIYFVEVSKWGKTMKGIILLANHFEDTEALVTIDLLRRAGITVDMVSIEKSVDLVTQYNLKIKAEFTVDQLNLNDYSFLIIPGGKAVILTHLSSKITEDVVNHFAKKNQLIATICAAPSAVGKLGYLKNKEFTCFPGFEEYVVDGIYLPNKNVVVSNNYITAKAAGVTFDFAKEIIKYLTNEKTANKVINSVYYKGWWQLSFFFI